jgi:hypothetical protein
MGEEAAEAAAYEAETDRSVVLAPPKTSLFRDLSSVGATPLLIVEGNATV